MQNVASTTDTITSDSDQLGSDPPLVPPMAKGLPVVGSLPAFLKNPFPFLEETTKELGDIYTLNFGLTKVVILSNPDHARHVLQTNTANYRKGGPLWDLVGKLLGNGLVVSDGDFWQRQRRMMQPEFHSRRLAMLTETMVDAVEETLATWEAEIDAGKELELVTATNRVTMRIITKTLFGKSLPDSDLDEVSTAMSHILDYLIRGMVFGAIPEVVPLPGKRKFFQAIERFDQAVYKLIALARNHQGGVDTEESTLLAMLMDSVDEETGEGMTDVQLRDEVATLFVAGYETTSMAIAWGLIHLDKHPEIAERLREEVDRVLGDRRPTFEDLPALELTRQIFDETLRLTPSVWMLPRETVADDVLDGHRIDAGTVVVMLNYMIHRHPGHWDDPNSFIPERFSEENSAGRDQYAYTPFGGGKRLCIGKAFAQMEGTFILAMIAQRFRVKPDAQHAKPMISVTLRPKGNPTFSIQRR